MEDIIKLHDKKFRIMIPAAKIDEAVAASRSHAPRAGSLEALAAGLVSASKPITL